MRTVVLLIRCNSPMAMVVDVPSRIPAKVVLWLIWPKMPHRLMSDRVQRRWGGTGPAWDMRTAL